MNELMPFRTISIIGMAKNVGKTTTLNYLIKYFHSQKINLALTSIGRDGESKDVVTKTEKPQIFVFSGTVIATAENLLHLCDITKEIFATTNINTPFGKVVLVRALSDGYVQLGGPSITTQIADLIKNISTDKILVDGAVSRKTLANPNITEATILCTGASFSRSMEKTIDETRHIVEIFMLPKATKDGIYLEGAVSDTMLNNIIMTNKKLEGTYIIAEDASKMLIKPSTYEKIKIKKAILAVKNPIQLVGMTINPTAPHHAGYHPKVFLAKMQEAVDIPVYDLKNLR
ncbi:MAG: hypothetical protein FWE05_07895 [Defluviitaleaceae bacterium]|nr:hypothetical protein [Defluviitaleaceae bacterium]